MTPSSAPPTWSGRPLHEMLWPIEAASLLVSTAWREGPPPGDAPMLLLPGFMANDSSLQMLHHWLRSGGWRTYRSGLLWNVGPSLDTFHALERRLASVHQRTGQKVILVGHSRGGIMAKALATAHPDQVSLVVTLGAPLRTPPTVSSSVRAAAHVFSALHRLNPRTSSSLPEMECLTSECTCDFSAAYCAPMPSDVPLVSLYSPQDGVVWPEDSLTSYAHAVEVSGTHCGLSMNPAVFSALSTILEDLPARQS